MHFQVCLTCHNQWTLLLWTLLQGVSYSDGLIMKGFIKGSPYRKRSEGEKRIWKMKGKKCSLIILIIPFVMPWKWQFHSTTMKCWSVPDSMAPTLPSHPKNVYICTCTLIFFPLLQQKHRKVTAGGKNTMSKAERKNLMLPAWFLETPHIYMWEKWLSCWDFALSHITDSQQSLRIAKCLVYYWVTHY